ncbi:MAG TPA: type VI secretion system protein TssA [Pyrinomonadaceae bacterium]|nr:type VI secretion system protein TssA [Pyrinomonadaceae bacterium]
MSGLILSYKIDIQSLLQPISGPKQTGESLRYEGTYDRIQDARREDNQTLSQGIYYASLKRADWQAEETICLEALETRTKDLQIAGWLVESWLHLYGFSGVEAGLNLLTALCQNFWNDLYPSLDGESVEDRIAPIEWINQKLSQQLKLISLAAPTEADKETYSYADWERACHYENIARRDPAQAQEVSTKIRPSVIEFRDRLMTTDPSFSQTLTEDLEGAMNTCGLLQELLDEKCGKDSPSLHQFHEVLSVIHQLVTEILQVPDAESPTVELGIPLATRTSEAETQLWSYGPIRTRTDAYRRLSEAADYLLRTEPHSPTPYLVKRAVEWGDMSLFEVLQQIVRNQGEMQELDKLLKLTGKQVADMK